MFADIELQEIEKKLNKAIEDYSIEIHNDEPRTHLGISEIGDPCSRRLYYKFHWMKFEYFDGRMRRLFKRGHREEERFINYLEGIGFDVKRFQDPILNYHPESDSYFYSAEFIPGDGLTHDVTGMIEHEKEAEKRGLRRKQFRVSAVMGHYGGSCDGIGMSPWGSKHDTRYAFLLEFKTHNQKSFDKYLADGLIKSKPKHYDQMCGYGYMMNINYGIYWPENKNTDEITTKVIRLDHNRGAQLLNKAEEIITAVEPPQRISDNPAFHECKFCAFLEICHYNAQPIKNCRSCRMAVATENGTWTCKRFNDIIPPDFIKTGCNDWCPI